MNDSRRAPSPAAGATPVSVPSAARATVTIGWMMRCSVSPWRLTSIVTESTRNGMSSLTISTIVCVDCQPCSSIVGLNTRTFARPGSRLRAKFQCDSAAPYRSASCALGEILGVDLAVVRRARTPRACRAAPAPPWRARAPRARSGAPRDGPAQPCWPSWFRSSGCGVPAVTGTPSCIAIMSRFDDTERFRPVQPGPSRLPRKVSTSNTTCPSACA